MARHVEINGLSTWVEDFGAGPEVVLLLHGGLSNSDDLLDTIGHRLDDRYRMVAFDRRGHGRTADTEAPFHYRSMRDEAISVLEQVVGGPAHLVGWSDGGIVALLVAIKRPDLVDRMVVIGTNYHFEGLVPYEFQRSSDVVLGMSSIYAEHSPDGAEHFWKVLEKSEAMSAVEPTISIEELNAIGAPTLVLAGDDDMIHLTHTTSMYEALPAGRLAIVPGTSHALPLEAPVEVARMVAEFLDAADPPVTFMPVRRSVDDYGPRP